MSTSITRRAFLKGSLAGLTLAVSVSPFGYRILNASEQKDIPGFSPMPGLPLLRITRSPSSSVMPKWDKAS